LILDEYVDGIHFILSLLIYYQITPIFNIKSIKKNDDKTALTLCFLELFKMVNQLAKTNGNKTMFLKKFCIKYLELGNMLGFNIEKITNGYLKKNQINYERQKSNY
jgi:dimeric dUTPase (all-alpha-NTP-PPase superfamily)